MQVSCWRASFEAYDPLAEPAPAPRGAAASSDAAWHQAGKGEPHRVTTHGSRREPHKLAIPHFKIMSLWYALIMSSWYSMPQVDSDVGELEIKIL